MESIIDRFFDKFEMFFDALIHLVEYVLDVFFHGFENTFHSIMKLISNTIENYSKFSRAFYSFFRWTTIPLNYLIVHTWLWYIFAYDEKDPLDVKGIHYIRGLPRKGKSLLAYDKANKDMEDTGYSSYMTSKIEKPKMTEDGKHLYVNHNVIDLKTYYKDGIKIKRFNTKYFKKLWVDEFHVLNNPRRNNEKANKDFVIPLINDFVKLAHNGFDCIYLLSQVPSNDVQIMSILVGYHDIEVVKGVNYLRWLITGKFEILPLYIKIKSYEIVWDSTGNMRKVLKRVWKHRIDLEKLPWFDTLAERDADKHLPYDYKGA